MIAFRADANKYTATGHAMRCMSIAQAVVERGGEVVFIVADEDSRAFVEARGYRVEVLNTDWRDMDGELTVLFKLLRKINPSWLVISSYQTTDAYLKALTAEVKTMFIDDLNDRVYPVSALVNYNIYAESLPYAEMYAERDTRLLLGTEYIPLREQFRRVTAKASTGKNVFISTGGTDNYGMAGQLIRAADRREYCSDWCFHIVSGHFGSTTAVPESMADRVFIHRNVTEMAELMSSCSLAVTAGGSTYYELCACGVPSVAYSLSDDQLPGALEFDRIGLIRYCGDIRTDIDGTVSRVLQELNEILNNRKLYQDKSEKMKSIVDGRGALRIADILTNKER